MIEVFNARRKFKVKFHKMKLIKKALRLLLKAINLEQRRRDSNPRTP
jgi:hypothetical protein